MVLETGESRQLTSGLTYDSNPVWSPDGKYIAFLSSRGEKPHIYLIPVDGGEAKALTSLAQGASGGPVWSPDGKHIAFTAGPEKEPPKPEDPYRVTRHVYRFDAMGYLDNVIQDIYIIPIEGGEPKQLTKDYWNNTMPEWSPDGKEILFSTNMRPDSHRIPGGLRIMNIDGETWDLVYEWGGAMSGTWLPDGKRVAFVGTPIDSPGGTQGDLYVIDREGGEPECRTTGLDYCVGGGLQSDMPVMSFASRILLAEDGRNAYIKVQVRGTVQIYRVALSGPISWAPVIFGERSCTPLDIHENTLLYAVSTLNDPIDIYCHHMNGENERRLTRINEGLLKEFELPSVERLLFLSTDGIQVEGWIMKPPVEEAPYPTVLYIHGGPHSGFGHVYSFDFQMLAGSGFAVLFINQRGSTGYGDEFASKIIGDWGNLDYKDLMSGVDYAIEKGIADPKRLGCCGLSGGGNLTTWIVGQTDRFKAAVPENPVTNWVSFYGCSDIGPWFSVRELGGLPQDIPEIYRKCSPITYSHKCKTPTLLIQGEHDYRCPAEQSEQFYSVLKANGCVVEMLRLPNSSHTGAIRGPLKSRKSQNEALLGWMNRYVLGIKPE